MRVECGDIVCYEDIEATAMTICFLSFLVVCCPLACCKSTLGDKVKVKFGSGHKALGLGSGVDMYKRVYVCTYADVFLPDVHALPQNVQLIRRKSSHRTSRAQGFFGVNRRP